MTRAEITRRARKAVTVTYDNGRNRLKISPPSWFVYLAAGSNAVLVCHTGSRALACRMAGTTRMIVSGLMRGETPKEYRPYNLRRRHRLLVHERPL